MFGSTFSSLSLGERVNEHRARITATSPGELRITLMRADVLAEPIVLPMPAPATPVDLALVREMDRLESRLGFLASIGSSAPFIGLFGTVVGIMTSFQAIAGSKSTNLAVVAPGISEALLATAIGLLAAIPAVIAYNKLSSDAAKLGGRMEGFADEFSTILSRQIDEKVAAKAA